jgi:ATP-dependent helicase/nuclease subunit A
MKQDQNIFHPRLLIVANAGSGKTHRLVTRCIQLLDRGHQPEEILALTFTRKAAAEFLQKLFERLGDAVENEVRRDRLRDELGRDELSVDRCLAWMRQLLAVLPKLAMGTLDQFFARIVRSFPFELGIAREFELLDEAAQEENLIRTLDALFRESAEDEGGLGELVEMLRQSSRNRSDSSALRELKEGVIRLHEQIAGASKDAPWGDAATIWPKGSPLLPPPPVVPLATAARQWMNEVMATQGDRLTPEFRARLEAWVDHAVRRLPGARMNTALKDLMKKLSNEWKQVKKYNATILAFGRNAGTEGLCDLGDVRRFSEILHRSIISNEIQSRLKSSAALRNLLVRYDEIYSRTVRDTGALTFADIAQVLVGQTGELSPWIGYRLDSRYQHWLLDEFQDTSRAQWNILEPLVDAILTETSEERSFFYVGDTKQSIYGWRDGDDRLFWEIEERYNQHRDGHIARVDLEIARRSDRAVLDVVNALFNADRVNDHLNPFKIPADVGERWARAWVTHHAREDADDGYVRLHHVSDEDGEDSQRALEREVVRLVKEEVRPLEKGLSCAVLARTGGMVNRMARALKEAGVEVVVEGKVRPCSADPESRALLAGIRAVASPCDRIAETHFLFSPIGRAVSVDGMSSLRAIAMRKAADDGFAAVVLDWIGRGALAGVIDARRFDAFVDAASAFDTSRRPGDDWLSFVRYLEHHSIEENEAPGAVRVMTIHKAKGLGMDMVILPELTGRAFGAIETSGVALHRIPDGKVQWGLSMPPKEICEQDEVLSEARDAMVAKQGFNELCVFYVAMTRAKHAVYCLMPSGGRDEANAARWLKLAFPAGSTEDAMREVGNRDWFHQVAGESPAEATMIHGDAPDRALRARHGAAPSSHLGEPISAGLILGGGSARRLGSEVHELLARIEWLDGTHDVDSDHPDAVALVCSFLGSERARILSRPSGRMLLWRERAFDVLLEGEPLTGVFDRVHVTLDGDGKPMSAHIIDFKTDLDTDGLAARYAAQLEAYRQAAAVLLGIAVDRVSAEAVAVRG